MTELGRQWRLCLVQRWAALSVIITLGGLPARALSAQVRDTTIEQATRDSVWVERSAPADAHVIRWYEVAGTLGGIGLLAVLDEPLQRFVQRHRSGTLDDVSGVFRHEGEPLYYAGVSLGVLAVGLIAHDRDIERAGARLTASVGIAGIALEGMKYVTGRSRPNEGVGAFSFHPFTTLNDSTGLEARNALPSGHATAAFAIAASLADDIHSPVVGVLLYTAAAGTGWSRINDNRHWLTDTAMGAALGITTAKLVSGRWRIFHLRPPSFLVAPSGAPALSWTVAF